MAVREKRVVQEVLVCDYCETDILDETGTHITGNASGYMKKEGFEFDLCANCATSIGLKRRGRRPAGDKEDAEVIQLADNQAAPAPKKRGRPRKNPLPEVAAPQPEAKQMAVGQAHVEEW